MLFFTQKTAYEMRISDWSSDVCSSDLLVAHRLKFADEQAEGGAMLGDRAVAVDDDHLPALAQCGAQPPQEDRKSVVEGKSVSERVDLGGRRIMKKNTTQQRNTAAQGNSHPKAHDHGDPHQPTKQ